MKSFDLHVFFDRHGRPRVSCSLDRAEHLPAVDLSEEELDLLARIATRSAFALIHAAGRSL
jgi:hypothetical protein